MQDCEVIGWAELCERRKLTAGSCFQLEWLGHMQFDQHHAGGGCFQVVLRSHFQVRESGMVRGVSMCKGTAALNIVCFIFCFWSFCKCIEDCLQHAQKFSCSICALFPCKAGLPHVIVRTWSSFRALQPAEPSAL